MQCGPSGSRRGARGAAAWTRTYRARTGPAAVVCSIRVRINSGRTPIRADIVADRLPEASWHRQSAGTGAKGLRYYDWAWIHIGTGEHRHLLIRRNPTTRELAFYLCWSPTAAPLAELVRVAGSRWSVDTGRAPRVPVLGEQGTTSLSAGRHHSARAPSCRRQIGLRQRWPVAAACSTAFSSTSMPRPGSVRRSTWPSR